VRNPSLAAYPLIRRLVSLLAGPFQPFCVFSLGRNTCSKGLCFQNGLLLVDDPVLVLELGRLAGSPLKVTFTAQVVPLCRGILSCLYATLDAGWTREKMLSLYRDFYAGSPFIRIYDRTSSIGVQQVRGTNRCALTVRRRRDAKRTGGIGVVEKYPLLRQALDIGGDDPAGHYRFHGRSPQGRAGYLPGGFFGPWRHQMADHPTGGPAGGPPRNSHRYYPGAQQGGR